MDLPESNIILVLMPQLVVVTSDTLKQTGGPAEVKEKGFVPLKSRFADVCEFVTRKPLNCWNYTKRS